MYCQADGSTTVHFCCLPIQRWYLNLWSCGRIRCRDVKLEVKLVLDELVDVPALSRPVCALFVGGDGEPIRVCAFVDLDVSDEGLQLLQQIDEVFFVVIPHWSPVRFILAQNPRNLQVN